MFSLEYSGLEDPMEGVRRAESGKHRSESFKNIFNQNLWGPETKSGHGSTISATSDIRNTLDMVIKKIKIHLNKNKIR